MAWRWLTFLLLESRKLFRFYKAWRLAYFSEDHFLSYQKKKKSLIPNGKYVTFSLTQLYSEQPTRGSMLLHTLSIFIFWRGSGSTANWKKEIGRKNFLSGPIFEFRPRSALPGRSTRNVVLAFRNERTAFASESLRLISKCGRMTHADLNEPTQ